MLAGRIILVTIDPQRAAASRASTRDSHKSPVELRNGYYRNAPALDFIFRFVRFCATDCVPGFRISSMMALVYCSCTIKFGRRMVYSDGVIMT